MTRIEWLKSKHTELDNRINILEQERYITRDFDHKTLVIDLKKQKLAIKTEILSLEIQTVCN